MRLCLFRVPQVSTFQKEKKRQYFACQGSKKQVTSGVSSRNSFLIPFFRSINTHVGCPKPIFKKLGISLYRKPFANLIKTKLRQSSKFKSTWGQLLRDTTQQLNPRKKSEEAGLVKLNSEPPPVQQIIFLCHIWPKRGPRGGGAKGEETQTYDRLSLQGSWEIWDRYVRPDVRTRLQGLIDWLWWQRTCF